MENYIVSARKYRPMTFDTVVGQKSLTTTLKNAVKSGKLAHAYLFCGPRGVGKTTCARIFAKTINCEHPNESGEACNECESCKAFNENRSLNIFELDAASNNGVEQIKSLMEQTRIPPQIGKYKVFIIDEVHMLSSSAFNAFLKTLEEPPERVIFILATTEKHKVLPTIISRCQIYDFERIGVRDIVENLKSVAEKEGIKCEDTALEIIAEKADGGMRDALSTFDQVVSFCQGDVTYEKVIENLNLIDVDNYFKLVDLALDNQITDIMLLVDKILSRGFDGGQLINGLAAHIRNVLVAKDASTLPLLEVSDKQRQRYQEQALKCPTPFLYKALKILNQCDINYRQSSNKRLLVELTLIQVAQGTQPDDDAVGVGRRPKRLKSLFKKKMQAQTQTTNKQVVDAVQSTNVLSKAKQVGSIAMPSSKTSGMASEPAASQQQQSLDSLGITFGGIRQKMVSAPKPIEEPTQTNVFDQQQLQTEWLNLCNSMPKELIGIASRLKNIRPTIIEFPKVSIVVDNDSLLDEAKKIQGRLRATLAKRLGNTQISLVIRRAQKTEIKVSPTKQALYEAMRKENPAIDLLREALDLKFD